MGKTFKEDTSSLLGGKPKAKKKRATKKVAEPKPKRGRPKTSTKEITKTSQIGTKEKETRATFIVNEEQLDKVKAVAKLSGSQIKEVVAEALDRFIKAYEKKNGSIDSKKALEKKSIL